MTLPDRGRYAYNPITEGPEYSWPQGRRPAVYVALNLEHFAFGEGRWPQPDVLNYTWRDYRNRIGVWRWLELFQALIAGSRPDAACPARLPRRTSRSPCGTCGTCGNADAHRQACRADLADPAG